MDGISHSCEVLYNTIIVGSLNHYTGHASFGEFPLQVIAVGDTVALCNADNVDAMIVGVGINHSARLWVKGFAYQHFRGFLCCAECHHHGLGRSGGTVVKRSIRDVHARELGHHALVFKDIVERALRYFGLIGRVTG